jgi:hypothetical protein
MGAKIRNIAGQRFGRLVVVQIDAVNKRGARWRCACDCGGKIIAPLGRLREGTVRSCGCLRRDQARINVMNTRAHRKRRAALPTIAEPPRSAENDDNNAALMLARLW